MIVGLLVNLDRKPYSHCNLPSSNPDGNPESTPPLKHERRPASCLGESVGIAEKSAPGAGQSTGPGAFFGIEGRKGFVPLQAS